MPNIELTSNLDWPTCSYRSATDKLSWVRRRTYHELNLLSLVHPMWSLMFDLGLTGLQWQSSISSVNQWKLLSLINSKSDDMVIKRHRSRNYPSPEYCILDMVNAHLKMNREGRKLTRGVLVCDIIPGDDKL